jgi:cytochrome c553
MATPLIRTLALLLATSTASVALAASEGEAGFKPDAPTKHTEMAVTCGIPHEDDYRSNLASEGVSSEQIERLVSEQYEKLCGDADGRAEVQKDWRPLRDGERPSAPTTSERPQVDSRLQAPERPRSGKRAE